MSRLPLYRLLVHYSVPHVDNQKYILRIRQRYFKSNFSLVFTGSVFQVFCLGQGERMLTVFAGKDGILKNIRTLYIIVVTGQSYLHNHCRRHHRQQRRCHNRNHQHHCCRRYHQHYQIRNIPTYLQLLKIITIIIVVVIINIVAIISLVFIIIIVAIISLVFIILIIIIIDAVVVLS